MQHGDRARRVLLDRDRAVTAILDLATYEGDPNVVYQASANIDDGLNTFDAFHAALSGGSIIHSDRTYNELAGVNRIRLEPHENEDSAARVRRSSVSRHDRPGRVVVVSVFSCHIYIAKFIGIFRPETADEYVFIRD